MKRPFLPLLSGLLSAVLFSCLLPSSPADAHTAAPPGNTAAECMAQTDRSTPLPLTTPEGAECIFPDIEGIQFTVSGDSVSSYPDENGQNHYYVLPGTSAVLSVSAEEGYAPGNVFLQDEVIGSGEGDYAFTMPETDARFDAERRYTVPVITGAGLSLSFRVQTNIYLQLPDGADPSVYGVLIQGPNDTNPLGTPVRLSDLSYAEGYGYQINYSFTARQMEETMSFSLYDLTGNRLPMFTLTNDGALATDTECFTYSVSRYLNDLSAMDDGYASLKSLGEALRQYGVFAHRYYYGETDEIDIPEALQSVSADTFSRFQMKTGSDFQPETVGYYGMSLVLKSDITFRLYFTEEPTDLKVTDAHGNPVSFVSGQRNGMYTVDIPHIGPSDLGNVYVFRFPDGSSLSACPWSYAYKVLSDDTLDENLQNTAKALYLYYLASVQYFGIS